MSFLDKHFGRLGNRMFQMAFLYSYAKDRNIDYYFQDERWFKHHENEIRALFGEGIDFEDKVSVHIRRAGNPTNPNEPKYTDNPFYVNLSETDYYQRAMALFPNEKFLMFSDDNEYLEKNFQGDRFEFATGTEEEDLKRMASCKAHIIANSSFSWWGAYLNPRPDKKVIYPLNWYSDGVERTFCPKEWTGI